MFPIPWNFPFKKKDGTTTTIDAAISSGGGGGYTLPTASASTKGGVKIGSGLTMDGEVLSATGGGYDLPTASASTKGGIKIGSGLSMDGEVLNNSNPTPYTLPTAAANVLGGVKVGSNLSIDENGVLSASGGGGYELPTASDSTKGGVKIGSGLSMTGEVLSNDNPVPTMTTLTSMPNVATGTDLKISHVGDIVTLSGKVVLTNELAVNGTVQIGQNSIPSDLRIGNRNCPMVITVRNGDGTLTSIAILRADSSGNLYVENSFADFALKTLYVNCSYRKMSY